MAIFQFNCFILFIFFSNSYFNWTVSWGKHSYDGQIKTVSQGIDSTIPVYNSDTVFTNKDIVSHKWSVTVVIHLNNYLVYKAKWTWSMPLLIIRDCLYIIPIDLFTERRLLTARTFIHLIDFLPLIQIQYRYGRCSYVTL